MPSLREMQNLSRDLCCDLADLKYCADGSARSHSDLRLQGVSTLHRGTQISTAVEQSRAVPC